MDHELDVLLPYDTEKAVKSSIAVIAVRPETNKIDYEAVIIKAVKEFGSSIYMANLNGILLSHKAVIIGHYSCQFQFAAEGKSGMRKYPEMIEKFEQKFNIEFNSANIIGSMEAVSDYSDEIKKTPEELFNTMVSRNDFLEMYGQTIKKIGDYYILNYDLPAVLKRYSDSTNILVFAIAMSDPETPFHKLNYSIYKHFCENGVITMIDSQKRSKMEWYNQVKRTYHISHNHIEAMFDLKDYVFDSGKNNVSFCNTPLGRKILDSSKLSSSEIERKIFNVKNNPLQYIHSNEDRQLVYMITEGSDYSSDVIKEKTIEECCTLFENIEFT